MLKLIESKLIFVDPGDVDKCSSIWPGILSHFFSLFTVTFVRNSENSPFKHVESFSQNKCKSKTQHSRKVMKPRIG